MKVDAGRIAAIAREWPPGLRLVLLCGPDESASREMAGQLLAGLAAPSVSELAGAGLKQDPQALVAAATSLSMFGDREVVRVDGLDDDGVAAVQALLDGPPGHPVIALAGNLKKGSKLLTLAEKSPEIAVCLSYEATLRDAGRLVAAMAAPLGLRPERGVAEALFEAAAGDRMVMRAELEKYALYTDAAPDRPQRLGLDDLAVIGIATGEAEMSAPVVATTSGETVALSDLVGRLGDGFAIPLLRALDRRLGLLIALRADVDSGTTPAAAVENAGRAVFWKDKPDLIKALQRWDQPALAAAMAQVLAAERAVKAPGGIADLGTHQLLLELARDAAGRAPRR